PLESARAKGSAEMPAFISGPVRIQVGAMLLKKSSQRQRLSVPAINKSSLVGDLSKREMKGAPRPSIPLTSNVKFSPPSTVRKILRPCEETAQSVFGRELEMTLSAPSPKKVNSQALDPLHRSVPLS